jgi:hypothetical protein
VLSACPQIIINYCSLTLLLNSVARDWDRSLRTLLGVVSWAAMFSGQSESAQGDDTSVSAMLSADCLLMLFGIQDPVALLTARLVASLLLPALSVLAVLCIVAAVRRLPVHKDGDGQPKLFPGTGSLDRIVVTSLVVLTTQQFSVSLVFLEAFTCVEANGRSYLEDSTAVVCMSSQHWTLMGLALAGLAIYTAGFFGGLIFVFRKYRRQLKTSARFLVRSMVPLLTFAVLSPRTHVRKRYSFLFRGFQGTFFYWDVLVSLRKLLLR